MPVKCKICNNEYSAVNNLNKHVRKKHPGVLIEVSKARANVYICDYCGETFNNKMLLLKHIVNHTIRRPTNIYCSFENCDKTFKTMKSLTHHLESDHNENIKVEHLKFETMEEFNNWKKSVEEKENCQYVRRTSMKPGNKVQYMYYDCHRSYSPRLNGTEMKIPKCTVKIGKVCPSRIRIVKKGHNLSVEFYSTHLWHKNEIIKLRTLCRKKRSKLSGKLSKNVPVNLKKSKQNISRIEQLVLASHNKSMNISVDMIKQTENSWMICSTTDKTIQFKVEKAISSCNGCVHSCKLCQICIHSYTCTCDDNALYLNICEHIHACVQRNLCMSQIIPVLRENQCLINDQLGIKLENDTYNMHTVLHSQVTSKMEIMLDILYNKFDSSMDDLNYISKYCDNILSLLEKEQTHELKKKQL